MNSHNGYTENVNQQSINPERSSNSARPHGGVFTQPSTDPATQQQPGSYFEPIK
jgi:hypothetical protein